MRWSRLWRKIIKETHKKTAPILALSKAIIDGSLSTANSLRPSMGFNSQEENEKNWVYVLFEVQYLFFHLVSRMASQTVGADRRSALLESMAPLVIDPTINAIFGHWPDDKKNNIKSQYYENLAKSEYQYGACKNLWNREGVDNMNDIVIWRFAKNVARAMGNEHNPGLIIEVEKTLVYGLKDIEFKRLLQKACAVQENIEERNCKAWRNET